MRWSPSNDYDEGDIVAFEYTNYNHATEDLGTIGFDTPEVPSFGILLEQ